MRPGKRGVSVPVLAVAVVVVALVAAGAYYFAYGAAALPGGSSTSESSLATGPTSATQTTGCPGPQDPTNLTGMFADYSAITMRYNGTINGNIVDQLTSYVVTETTHSVVRVNVTVVEASSYNKYVDYVFRNGSVDAVTYLGTNYTGGNAEGLYLASVSNYYISNVFEELLGTLTNAGYVHPTGTDPASLGQATVAATTYAAGSLPLATDVCGNTTDLSEFSMTTGSIEGVPTVLLVHMHLAGSVTLAGNTQTVSVTLAATSVARA